MLKLRHKILIFGTAKLDGKYLFSISLLMTILRDKDKTEEILETCQLWSPCR